MRQEPAGDPLDGLEGLDDYDRMLVADLEWNRPIYETAPPADVPVVVRPASTGGAVGSAGPGP